MCIFVLLSYYMASMEDAEKRKFPAAVQTVVLLLFHAAGYLILWIKLQNIEIAVMYVLEVFFLLIFMYAFHVLYPRSSQAFLNNICFFMALGFVMVTRLDMDKGQRQFLFLFAGGILSLILPWLMTRIRGLRKMSWLYAAAGIIALAVVVVFGRTDYGANLAVELGGFSLQPAEFVKIVYVFFIAAMLRENTGFKNIVITSFLAAVHVVILVLATDLGSAFIYFCAYVIMLYSATGKPIYAGLGIGGGAAASYIAYQLFSHVKTRVVVWLDPWSYIDNEGYQITQSLFGIGMGSWLGSGLFDGMPEKIPFVEKDFMFSAIAEEFGVVFAIGVILLCLNTVLLMLQAGMKLSEPFYRLLAVGFASVYGIQVFLTIGGGMNLIPITGVTLPLVSYGGSSAVSTLLMFAIVQGLNLIDEVDTVEKRKRKKSKTT
jgi:cell division protein FtsW